MPPVPPAAPVRTMRTSLVLRRVGFHSSSADDPIVRLVSAFLTRVPTWLSALHRNVPEETALWAVQWLLAHNVPEEDSYWAEGNHFTDYTPMDRAAKRGYLAVVQFLHEHSAHGCTKYAVESAVKNNHAEVLRFLYENRWELEDVIRGYGYLTYELSVAIDQWVRAVRSGDLTDLERAQTQVPASAFAALHAPLVDAMREVIDCGLIAVAEWLHEHAPASRPCAQLAFRRVIEAGRVESVRLALAQGQPLDYANAIACAAQEGQLEIVKLIWETRPESCLTADAFRYAAWNDRLEVMRFLCEKGSAGDSSVAIDCAAAAGSLQTLAFLHENSIEGCTTYAIDMAAECGHAEIVQFLMEHRSEGCTTVAMDEAAANGHLEIVQYLYAHSSVGCTTAAMDQAAAYGHVEVVRFLHEHRLEHSCMETALKAAFAAGHLAVKRLDLLEYAHDAGLVVLRPSNLDEAVSSEQLELIQFVYDRCAFTESEERDTVTRLAIVSAVQRGLTSAVIWLDGKREHGRRNAPECRALEYAVGKGHLEIAEYLFRHGYEEANWMLGLAVYKDGLDLVQSLDAQRTHGCNHDLIESAAQGGHLEVVRYLCDRRDCNHRLVNSVNRACIKNGHLELLVYLYDRDLLELKPTDFELAVKSTCANDMLEFLYNVCVVPTPERRVWVLRNAIEAAAKLGTMRALELIDSKRLDGEVFVASRAMEYAAKRGHLEIAEYLITHGHAGCTGALMNLAAFRGRLDLVRFLHETRGDGLNETALQLAVRKGHNDISAYIREGSLETEGPDVVCRCRDCVEGNVYREEPVVVQGDGDY